MARIALVTCVLLSPFAVPQSAAAALTTCESNPSDTHHVGWKRPSAGSVAYGVRAIITAERGALCSSDLSDHNFNTVYVMIAQGSPDTDEFVGWAQAGYHRFPHEVTYHYYQYRHGNPPPGDASADIQTEFYYSPVTGEVGYEYVVRYGDPCSCLRMFIGGTLVANTDFDPFVSWSGTGPWSYQIMAESRYKASDVPGSPTDKTEIYGMQLWSSVNQYYEMPCNSLESHNDNSGRWTTSKSTCGSAQIWTK